MKADEAENLDFLPYMNKVSKLPTFLRRARKVLPDTFLMLDKIDPLSSLVLMNVRLSVKRAQLRLEVMTKEAVSKLTKKRGIFLLNFNTTAFDAAPTRHICAL